MNRLSTFLLLIISSLASCCLPDSTGQAARPDGTLPNVVLIMTDNHGAWTLGCYGNPDIRTPNIDRLATEGTLFTRAFASNPVCSPTRATFLTGLVPSQHGVHSFLAGTGLQTGPNARCTLDQFTSLPEVLDDAGYDCGLVGKWHLGGNLTPQEKLDDHWITMPHGSTSTFYGANIIEDGKVRKEPQYLTDLWTDHAVKFIDKQAKEDNPFFLFLSYNGPYALGRLLLRDGKNRHASYYADKEIASFPRVTPHPWQLHNRDYINNPTSIRRVATEVSGVDDGVGEVMQALKANGLDENTIVVFVADQGWVGGHGGFFGMGDHTSPLTARDGMMQIPMIWRQPQQIDAGKRNDQMIANYDFMPTLLGHLGMGDRMPTVPKSPGRDMSPLLTGKPYSQGADHDAIFYEFENLRCIRTTSHKYIHRHPNGPHQLHDLKNDPDEFVNLLDDPVHAKMRDNLKDRLDAFYGEYSLPQYDMWKGGTSQVRLYHGVDEEIAEPAIAPPPPLPDGFQAAPIQVPEGYSVELVAGPPLVTHPTMGCFDDRGNLYLCNNDGSNLSNEELEEQLPNSIRRLVDSDQDGHFDSYTVFADKMTFPMGGVWHQGSLFVASPPNIWRLTDTDDDGVADKREVIVEQFGYSGNAASIHGCFIGPEGRLYWTDGFHGHEFKDDDGNITSKRFGSYLFSCLDDGSDKQIHCGGGMDNPVELDFTESGDMLGTVNILYTRPRVDCLVHWLRGGAYPHRRKVLSELKVTGDLLEPAHRFGHVAISGMTRYRSGVMDHRFGDNLFATFFNGGKVVRLDMHREGSSYGATQHEFLSSTSREFHPTDVMEDADGSLLVVDTGGWFYRGCPTSQFAKPDLLGGVYRIKRDGMTTMVDPRGLRIDWKSATMGELVKLLGDTRFAVRRRAVNECAMRGKSAIATLQSWVKRGDIRVRRNSVAALSRLAQTDEHANAASSALRIALEDDRPNIRQLACRGLAHRLSKVPSDWITLLLKDNDAGVRRQAASTLGVLGDGETLSNLIAALDRDAMDRSEEHAVIYAMIEIGDAAAIRQAIGDSLTQGRLKDRVVRAVLIALDQIDDSEVEFDEVRVGLQANQEATLRVATRIAKKHPEWASQIIGVIRGLLANPSDGQTELTQTLLSAFVNQPSVGALLGEILSLEKYSENSKQLASRVISQAGKVEPHESWVSPLQSRLECSDNGELSLAIAAVSTIQGKHFQKLLMAIIDDPNRPMSIRMDALSAMRHWYDRLDNPSFERLMKLATESGSPTATSRAAQMIGSANLTSMQQQAVLPLLQHAAPAELRNLMRGFQRHVDIETAQGFFSSIESSDAWTALGEVELSEVIKNFPAETLDRGNRLLDQLKQRHQVKLLKLQSIGSKLHLGDAVRGQGVFLSEKAKCSSCHRVADQGAAVGPDLSTIGANRSANDLLESVVFPSASIVRDYGTHQVLTVDGRSWTGLLVSETAGTIELQQANGEKVSVSLDDIEQIAPSSVSIMPSGLEEALSEQELLDVVRYLQTLNSPKNP